jgi:hypothetical protein
MPPQPPPAYGYAGDTAATRRLGEKKGWAKKYSLEDRYSMAVYNQALQFLDPTSRGQIMRLMSQRMPEVFSGYASAETPAPPSGAAGRAYAQQVLDKERLDAAVEALTGENIYSAIRGGRKVTPGKGAEIQAHLNRATGGGLSWLRDYLTTAQQAYGTGPERMTRAERAYAQSRLGELAERAGEGQGPGAAYLDLAKVLVSPALSQAPVSGGLGTGRATTRTGGEQVRGGVAKRNIALT